MLADACDMGMTLFWAPWFGTGVKAQVGEAVGCTIGDEEGPDVGAREGSGAWDQVGEAVGRCVGAGKVP